MSGNFGNLVLGFGGDFLLPYTVTYLVVAGGGAGGAGSGGGGGAGGYRASTLELGIGEQYTITVGAGGAVSGTSSANGANSVFATITSTGGGKGGSNVVSPATGTAVVEYILLLVVQETQVLLTQ